MTYQVAVLFKIIVRSEDKSYLGNVFEKKMVYGFSKRRYVFRTRYQREDLGKWARQ